MKLLYLIAVTGISNTNPCFGIASHPIQKSKDYSLVGVITDSRAREGVAILRSHRSQRTLVLRKNERLDSKFSICAIQSRFVIICSQTSKKIVAAEGFASSAYTSSHNEFDDEMGVFQDHDPEPRRIGPRPFKGHLHDRNPSTFFSTDRVKNDPIVDRIIDHWSSDD